MKTPELKNNEYGFTLVEVLISLLIFTVAVTGVITVSSQGSMNVNSAKNRVIATFLADEGIELARAMRDTSVVSAVAAGATENDGWISFVSANGAGAPCSVSCDIDPTNNALSVPYPNNVDNVVDCSGFPGSFCSLYYIPSSGYYTSVATTPGLTPSIFKRKIVIDTTSIPDEASVTSTVEWKEGLNTLSVTQTETMFNWYH